MTADDRLALVRVKVERAKQHIRDLDIAVKSFFDTKPYVVGTKRNPQTPQLTYYMVSVGETPTTLTAIAGDVLQNLRSALDHLAYQLVLVGSGVSGPTRHTCFPISDDAAIYKVETPRKVRGMLPAAIEAIDAIKPYKGGNDTLWRLHRLNNVDKHRLLITTGSAFRALDLGSYMTQMLQRFIPPGSPLGAIEPLPAFYRPADRMFPLKAGDELFIGGSDDVPNEKMGFAFDIAFGEPQVVEGEPLLDTLQQMADLVDNLILAFKPFLA